MLVEGEEGEKRWKVALGAHTLTHTAWTARHYTHTEARAPLGRAQPSPRTAWGTPNTFSLLLVCVLWVDLGIF